MLDQKKKKSSNFVHLLGYIRIIHDLLWAKQRRRQSVLGFSREMEPTGYIDIDIDIDTDI